MIYSPKTLAMINHYHAHDLLPNQCGSSVVQTIDAPISLVWSIIKEFCNPQAYNQFVKSCTMRHGNGGIGSVRDLVMISGLPARTSSERLEKLDDDLHLIMFSIIGGDLRLVNYCSTITLHEDEDEKGEKKTVVIESYIVDVPRGNSKEDTCAFADTIISCNLRSLARVTEKLASS